MANACGVNRMGLRDKPVGDLASQRLGAHAREASRTSPVSAIRENDY